MDFTILIIIVVLAFAFDLINGFHDAANSIATVVFTKVLTPVQAVLWAAFFNFVAFFIAKYIIGEFGIADTVSKTVLPQFITHHVILAGLIAAITWNLLTWYLGIPSYSSHTLIGGFAGAAIAASGSISGSGCDRAKMTWPGRTISGEMTWPLEVVAMTMSALLMISSRDVIIPPSASCLLALISDRVVPQTGFPV